MIDLTQRLRDHERHAVHDHDDDCHAAAAEIESLRSRLVEAERAYGEAARAYDELVAERALIVQRAENAEAALVEAEAKIAELRDALGCEMDDTRNACAVVNAEIDRVNKRLAAADALLREARLYVTDSNPKHLLPRIDAHLARTP